MHISHSLSLFSIGIKGIIGFLSLLNAIHTPGTKMCLLQMDSEGRGAALKCTCVYLLYLH